MNNSLIYAIIPARSGSKGVPHKNLKLLHGHPLLAWSIVVAKQCPSIDRVIVSTDSEEYAQIAKNYGADVPFLRPDEISHDTSLDYDFFLHALKWLQENENVNVKHLVHLRPTTPLRDSMLIEKAIEAYLLHSGKYALRSAHLAPESPEKWFRMENNFFRGLLGDDKLSLPRQKCQTAYIPNGYVDIVSVQEIIEKKSVYTPPLLPFVTPVTYEVDTMEEFEYISVLSSTHKLLDCLNKYHSIGA